jgi:hypothetical protein
MKTSKAVLNPLLLVLVDADTTICHKTKPHTWHSLGVSWWVLLMSHMRWHWIRKIISLEDVAIAAELNGWGCQLGLVVACLTKFYNQHFTLGVSVMFGSWVCMVKAMEWAPAGKLGALSMFCLPVQDLSTAWKLFEVDTSMGTGWHHLLLPLLT